MERKSITMEKKQGKNNAYLPNLETFFQAGIDPKTKLPIKFTHPCDLSRDIYRLLQIINRVQKLHHINGTICLQVLMDV